MIKKIQKYLLENYPLIWNIRLFPVLLTIIAANLIFFGIGYLSTDTAFGADGYNYYSDGLAVIYFASVVIGVLILIGWLIHYMRNNAFKVYYPRKASHLYLEWILCFVICIGISVIPLSLTEGCNKKWRAASSLADTQRALEIIEQAEILIPRSTYSYEYRSSSEDMQPIRIPDGMPMNLDSLNLDLYSFVQDSQNNLIIKGYIGPSLLFYNEDYYYDYNSSARTLSEKGKRIKQIKTWLQNGEKEKIKALMEDYMLLVQKHKIPTNLTVDTWFNRIYHPPFFAVDTNSFIHNSSSSSYYYNNSYYYPSSSEPYLDEYNLRRGYQKIQDSYEDYEFVRILTLICLCISLVVSILIFSCRVTTIRKWLQAIVLVGVLQLLISFITVLMSLNSHSEALFALSMFGTWVVLFIAILIYGINKINNNENKGKSNILINIFIWLIPCLIPLLFFIIHLFEFFDYDYRYGRHFEENVELMFWINIPVTVIFMLFASLFIRKWKGLPDE